MPALPIPSLTMLLWGQAPGGVPPAWLQWLYVWGEPSQSIPGTAGGLLTWLKVVALFCLLGWAGSWLIASFKERRSPRGSRLGGGLTALDVMLLIGLVLGLGASLLGVMVSAGRLPAGLGRASAVLGLAAGLMAAVWIEARLWGVLSRQGQRADRAVLMAMHAALLLGFAVSFGIIVTGGGFGRLQLRLADGFIFGGRLGATYMGFVAMARIAALLLPEAAAVRGRRLYAIAWHSWTEAFRRMWAPWVVIVVFAVILAFTSWFLQPPRPAELGRLYVGTLMLLTSLLVTVLVVILAPVSLPNDVRQQTVYTIVSKPTRRLEMIWGRVLGYMALVSVLVLFFGGVSLIYYYRQVNAAIHEATAKAEQAQKENKPEFAAQFRDQAQQLATRMRARMPLYGSLIFYDSKGNRKKSGIDVGIELPGRSFVEGATPSRAIWRYGRVENPRNRGEVLDRRLPVADLLRPGTIEYVEDQLYRARDEAARAGLQSKEGGSTKTAELRELTQRKAAAEERSRSLESQLAQLRRQDRDLRAKGQRREADALHSPRIPLEMTFNIYRTTKGEIGEPVLASVTATSLRPGSVPYRAVLPIREYYTNRHAIPASVLAGSDGNLEVEVKCLTVNQYLGMAEPDMVLLASEGRFWPNFLRGLFGVWLQALVLTAIGVCAGTFLSWPVALLTTIFFFVAGNVGFTALQQFALSRELVGGGPFESLIRMLSHDNLVSDLAPTVAVVTAKTLDSVVMPVMSRLVYVVPNFTALDVSNVVAEGFAVTWEMMGAGLLLALAYALPFSIVAYFILRQREVAA